MSNTPFTNIACRLLGHQMKPQGVTPFSVPLAMHEGRILSESNQTSSLYLCRRCEIPWGTVLNGSWTLADLQGKNTAAELERMMAGAGKK